MKVANQGCLGVDSGVKVSFYEEELGLVDTVETKGRSRRADPRASA